MNGEDDPRGRWRLASAVGAVLGAGLFALGALADPRRALFAYLTSYVFGWSLVLGMLFWVMIQHVTGAYWFVALRRTAERCFQPLPLLALLFAPILIGLPWLYSWAEPERIADPQLREAVAHKLVYLNAGFFALRALLYFAIWSGCAALLWRCSLQQSSVRALRAPAPGEEDTGPAALLLGESAELARRQKRLSAAFLPASAFALHFAAVDWLMSLEPTWASAVFGVYVFAGSALGALALLIVAVRLLEHGGRLRGVLSVSHYHALGKLLFTMLVFWAYIGFFQFFIIWIADVPEEVSWYARRMAGGFAPLALALGIGHFALPFFALLSRDLKRSRSRLTAVAAWLLAMHYLDVYWMVIPSLGPGAGAHWLDAAALVAISGALLWFGIGRALRAPALAWGDPRFERALRFETH